MAPSIEGNTTPWSDRGTLTRHPSGRVDDADAMMAPCSTGCSSPNPTCSATTISCASGVKRWDGIRSFQARNYLREMRRGDQAVFYHSNANPPGAAGICRVVAEAEPDVTQFDPTAKYYDPTSPPDDPRWDVVTVAPLRKLRFLPLDELRAMPELAGSRLVARGNRLSVLPLTAAEFEAISTRGATRSRRR